MRIERFAPVRRPLIWEAVPAHEWNSWVWQQQKRIKQVSQLESVVRLTDAEREAFEKCDALFRVAITPYFASLMDRENPDCPIRRQAIPRAEELAPLAE